MSTSCTSLEVIAAIRDVSTQKKLEAQLRENSVIIETQYQLLMEANRLKSEFVANLSHELRTPLSTIIGFADLMQQSTSEVASPAHRQYLGDIAESGKQLLGLIEGILDLARVDAGKMSFTCDPVDLSQEVGQVIRSLQHKAEEAKISIEVELDPAIGTVEVDRRRLAQALSAFVTCAIKLTAEGGRILVRTVPEGERSFEVQVEDTSIGVSPEDMGKRFVECARIDSSKDRRYAGMGLGLALARRLVEAMGGRVGVQKKAGTGSIFYAVLPRNPP